MEIAFSRIGDEESADRAIGIVRAESSASAVESRNGTVWRYGLQNSAPNRRIAQSLRALQIFLLRNIAEFAPMLSEMLIELPPRAEPGTGGNQQQRSQQQRD